MRKRKIAIVKVLDGHPFSMYSSTWSISGDELLGVLNYVEAHPEWEVVGHGTPLPPGQTLTSINELATENIAGVLVEGKTETVVTLCREHGIPVVGTNRYHDDPDVPAVCPDDPGIGRLAARYFLRRGFRSFAFCCPDYLTVFSGKSDPTHQVWCNLRLCAFQQAVLKAGAQFSVFPEHYVWPKGESEQECIERSARDLRAWVRGLPKPVAILGSADMWALACIQACHAEKIPVPHDAAVLGIDNGPIRCMASRPSLSSIDRNMWRIGYEAAARLCRRIEGKDGGENQMQLVPPKGVVERLSTDALAVADPKLAAALRFVRDNYSSPISRTDVARAARVSERSLDRLFQRDLGFALVDEIRRLRLEKACEMLTDSDLPLKLVAEASGFRSESYLCRVFSQEKDMSPAAWRSAHDHRGGPKNR